MPKIDERKWWEALSSNSLMNIENIRKKDRNNLCRRCKNAISTSVILNAISSTILRYYATNRSRIAWLLPAQRPDLNSHDFFHAQTLLDSHAECNACISSAAEWIHAKDCKRLLWGRAEWSERERSAYMERECIGAHTYARETSTYVSQGGE